MPADYSTLAATLAEISRRRSVVAHDEDRNPQQAYGGSGSFGYKEAYNDHMAKMWDMYAGMNIHKNSFGMAPQILDTDKNIQWMQSALADPKAIGGGAMGGILHTPRQTFIPDNSNPMKDRQARDPYSGTINSNTGLPNGVSSITGLPAYNGSNAPPQPQIHPAAMGLIAKLARDPAHAQGIADYLAAAGGGYGYGSGSGEGDFMSPYSGGYGDGMG